MTSTHLSHRILEVWQGFAKVLPNNQALEEYLSTSGCLIGESAWKTHSISREGDMPYVAKVVWKRGICQYCQLFMGVCRLSRSHDGWLMNDLPGTYPSSCETKKTGWVHYMELNDNQMILKRFRKQLVPRMMGGQVMVDCVHSSRVFHFMRLQGVIKLPIWGDQRMQMYGRFEGFPLK